MSFLWNSALQLRAASASMNSDLSPQLIKTTPLCPRSLFLLCNSDCASRQTAGVTGWGEGAVYLISCLSGITVLYCCCTMSKNSCSTYFCSDIQGFFLGGGVRMVNPLWPLKMLLKVNPYKNISFLGLNIIKMQRVLFLNHLCVGLYNNNFQTN